MKIVTFEHVWKRYRLSRLKAKSIREELVWAAERLFAGRGPSDAAEWRSGEFYALRDVSFDIEAGETLGLIGPNGSGKSTILKLLAHITYPTRGAIRVGGSVASLIEVGAGFHPELTGRENIYLYGSIMGMRQAEVRAKFDRIVDFAGLHEHLDKPVKYYSSGMYVRLGFSVAAHINPSVLLVDEVLAVGDAVFQSKCLQRIEELRRGGTTIVFVSHDMATVSWLCDRVLLLYEGKLRSEGEPNGVIAEYYGTVLREHASANNGSGSSAADAASPGAGAREAEIVDVRFFDQEGEEVGTFTTGEPMIARIEYRAAVAIVDPVFELHVYMPNGRLYCQYSTSTGGNPIPRLEGRGTVEIASDELGLAPGVFQVDAVVRPRGGREAYHQTPRRYVLTVLPGKQTGGMFYSPHRWRLLPGDEAQPTVDRTQRRDQG